MSGTAHEKTFNKNNKEQIKRILNIDDAEFEFWHQIELIQKRESRTTEEKKYRKREIDLAITKLGKTPLDIKGVPITKPGMLTGKTTKTQDIKYKDKLKSYYKDIYDKLDEYKKQYKDEIENLSAIKQEDEIVLSAVNPKDLLTKLPEFINKNNQKFKFSTTQEQEIKILNQAINEFYKDPTKYIDNVSTMRFERLEVEVARYRARIEEYRQFLQSHDPEHQSKQITKKLEGLKELRGKAKSKVDENALDEEIQVYQSLQTLYQRQQDAQFTPNKFFTQDDWAYERAHFKLKQDEKAIQEIKDQLSDKLKSHVDEKKKKVLQEQVKFYDALIQYFDTEKSKGKWPSYDGFIASQAPIMAFSPENYRNQQVKRISDTKSHLDSPLSYEIQQVLKGLSEASQNYQHTVPISSLEERQDKLSINAIFQELNEISKTNNEDKELRELCLFSNELSNYFRMAQEEEQVASLNDFIAPKVSQKKMSFKQQIEYKKQKIEQIKSKYDSGELQYAGNKKTFLDNFVKICDQYVSLTPVDETDENDIKEIVSHLEQELKFTQEKKPLQDQIAYYTAFIQFIHSEKTKDQWPTYENFLVSQAPTLFLSKDARDAYREELRAKIKDTSKLLLNPSSNITEVLGKLTKASEGFPHSTLRPKYPSTYDPQIVPVYTQYLESFAMDSIDLQWDAESRLMGDEPKFYKPFKIEYPESDLQFYESQYISARLQEITGKVDDFPDWKVKRKEDIKNIETEITQAVLQIQDLQAKIQEVEILWKKRQSDEQNILKFISEKTLIAVTDINQESVENYILEQQTQIQTIDNKIKFDKENKEKSTEELKEVEFLIETSNKIGSRSSVQSEVLYSTNKNPIKKVSYFISEKISEISIERPKDIEKYDFKAPTMSEYALVTYQNGAELYLDKNGKISVPPIPSLKYEEEVKEKFLATENEFITQLLQKYEDESSKGNKLPAIVLRGLEQYNPDYSDETRTRIVHKMVLQYSLKENGKIDNKKFNKIKIALLLGNASHDDSPYSFYALLESPSKVMKSGYYQLVLKAKKAEFVFGKDVTESVHPQNSKIQEMRARVESQRQLQKQSDIQNILKRNWNALPSRSQDNKKKVKENLQLIVDASSNDFDEVVRKRQIKTPKQIRIENAMQFLIKASGLPQDTVVEKLKELRCQNVPKASF